MIPIKTSTPQKLSISSSFIITIFAAFLLLIAYGLNWNIWTIALIPLLLLFSYFTNLYMFSVLINDKITPIYKTIREVPVEMKRSARLIHGNRDVLAEVDQEVKLWAEDKRAEIDRLKELERYRKDFVGNVSHELKTPIFNIQGYILTLLDGGLEDPKINRLYLERTEKSIDRMISVVEDLESITKLESGELVIYKEPFDLIKLTEEVFEFELRDAKERKMTMNLVVSAHKPVLVLADKKRIFEVISNLIGNAIKYGKKGGNVNVAFYDMDKMILIEVEDDGIGLEKKDLVRIFERFYRVDKSRSRMQGGTGLGLSIVKHIIEAHEQTIHVKSQLDQGTTFTFMLERAHK